MFASSLTTPLMRVSAIGGAAKGVTTLGPKQQGHVGPHFLPDGRRLLFYATGSPDTTGIYLVALEGGAPTRLTPANSTGAFSPAGWLLWGRAGNLVAQRLDVERAALTGEPVTLAEGMADDYFNLSAISVAATGLVAYRTATAKRQLSWFDRSGTARGTVGEPDGNDLRSPRVSSVGRRVFVNRSVEGNTDLWLLDGARTSRWTFDAALDAFPLWSPDGTRIVFSSARTGPFDIYLTLTSSPGLEERIVASNQTKVPFSWSANGGVLLYSSFDTQTNTDLWVVPMVGDRTPSVFLKTPFRETYGAFSPNGRWVAYQSNESGPPEIYVRPFAPPGAAGTAVVAAEGQWQRVSTAGGIHPVWRADGKELYYLDQAGTMMAAPIIVTGATLKPGAPMALFPTRIYGGGVDTQLGWQYDVAPDGRFLINTVLETADAPITLLMNWNPEATK